MAVYRRGYQRYQGPLTSRWARVMTLPRFAWQRLSAQRMFLIMMAISVIWPVLCAVYIYISNRDDLVGNLPGDLRRHLTIDAAFFRIFMNVQASFAVLLAALSGPGLIAPDLANNALPLYFSRPLSRLEYVLARMMTLFALLSLVTWAPGLLLVGMQSAMAGWTWFSAHWTIGLGVFCGLAIWVILVSLVALASSAYVKWRIIAGAAILAFFFITPGLARMVDAVLRVEWGTLLNPTGAMYVIWSAMLGADMPSGPGVWACATTLTVLAVLLGLIIEKKLRAVEVVA